MFLLDQTIDPIANGAGTGGDKKDPKGERKMGVAQSTTAHGGADDRGKARDGGQEQIEWDAHFGEPDDIG